jgi:isopenicillin N synthase-like dioxygenase
MAVAESVPVVDLRSRPASERLFAHQLGDALRDYGFVRVRGHGLDRALVEAAYEAARVFFALPLDVRSRYLVAGGAGERGWTPFGAEHAKDSETPDLKEFWHTGRELPPEHPVAAMYPPNLWPAEVPAFRGAMLDLYRALEAVAGELLTAIEQYLELAPGALTELTRDGNTILRALHYPPLARVQVPAGAVRAAAHEDINFITLLIASTSEGLQILRRDGTWLDVDAEEGEIIADVGDMLHRVTNGFLPATTHRVVNPTGSTSARYSMPFFVHPRPDAVLRVIDRCRGPEFPPPPPDITGRAFLWQRLAALGLVAEQR